MKQTSPSFLSFVINKLVRRSLFNPIELPKEPESYEPLKNAGLKITNLTASDNVSSLGWFKAPEKGKHTFLYFHGNTDNLGAYYRVDKYAEILKNGHGLFALGYRGFDVPFNGTITEKGLYRDARASIGFLVEEANIPLENIILFGESLGSGMAVQMAKENPQFAGIILDCPYPSIAHEIKYRHPYVPNGLLGLVEDKFDSIRKIPELTLPKLFIHAANDIVVPCSHGEILFKAAAEPKEFRKVDAPNTTHVEYPKDIFHNAITSFASKSATPLIKTTQKSQTMNAPQHTKVSFQRTPTISHLQRLTSEGINTTHLRAKL